MYYFKLFLIVLLLSSGYASSRYDLKSTYNKMIEYFAKLFEEQISEELSYMLELKKSNIPLMITSISNKEPKKSSGVDIQIRTQITTDKTIKHTRTKLSAYNAVHDKVTCDIRGYNVFTGRATGPYNFGDKTESHNAVIWSWSNAYYNFSLDCIKPLSINIEYMDGSKELYEGANLSKLYAPEKFRFPNMEWMNKYDPDSKTRLWPCDMIRFLDEMK